ncbi:MAG TPA: LysE family translocator, partial [Stellaceae bacterium]|nr:LysE family translocator [Stellaceae bacterium]
RAWRGASGGQPASPGVQVHFWRGFLVALSNPKTLAFFTAFLPQFVDPTRPAAFQLAVMCAVSVVLAAVSDSCWAVTAGLGRAWFVRPARARMLTRVSALTLIGGGIWLSLARRPT